MIGSIVTIVQPLEKRYRDAFGKQWDKHLSRIRSLSPGDLEKMDSEIRKLERFYELSDIKSLADTDEYSYTIQSLKTGLCEAILNKFRMTVKKIDILIGDHETVRDPELEARRFDDALSLFSILKALYSRWDLSNGRYRYSGENFDFEMSMKDVAYRLARKRKMLMEEKVYRSTVIEYSMKTGALGKANEAVSRMVRWYRETYLNTDGMNTAWFGSHVLDKDTSWMLVDFFDSEEHVAPLEKFRKIPSETEIEQMEGTVNKFIGHYIKNNLVETKEVGIVEDYERLLEYSVSFDMASDDPHIRLKSVVFDRLLALHRVLDDARNRRMLKHAKELEIGRSFVMYFAPIDEIYRILQRGYIYSEDSLKSSASGRPGLALEMNSEIRSGDIGFVFPITRVVEDARFTQLSSGSDELHVFSRDGSPVLLDIRKGFFIAPKERSVRFSQEGKRIEENCEDYFRRFFEALAQTADWFDAARLQGWHDRHCFFYTEKDRETFLGLLHNRSFGSVFNRFRKHNRDNLSLDQHPGTLNPTDDFATFEFETVNDKGRKSGTQKYNLTLFEWEST